MSIAAGIGTGTLLRRVGGVLTALGFGERRCVACREPFEPERDACAHEHVSAEGVLRDMLCPECRKKMHRRLTGCCPYCGEPSALEEAPCMPCMQCLQTLPPWREFLFFGVYEGLLRELLLRAKFGGSLAVLHMLGRLLAAVCREHYAVSSLPDVVIPMPLDRKRLRERGFNQCREMAVSVAKALGVPVLTDRLVKSHAVLPQECMNREQRKGLKQPFAAPVRLDGLHILLVDDVCTTGATLDRAVTCLLGAGASRVDVAVLARASLHTPAPAGQSPALP